MPVKRRTAWWNGAPTPFRQPLVPLPEVPPLPPVGPEPPPSTITTGPDGAPIVGPWLSSLLQPSANVRQSDGDEQSQK